MMILRYVIFVGLLSLAGCQTISNGKKVSLPQIYAGLPATVNEYNQELFRAIEELQVEEGVGQGRGAIPDATAIVFPETPLRLKHVSPIRTSLARDKVGVPVVLEYVADEKQSHYPPEGVFVNATGVYTEECGRPVIRFKRERSKVSLRGHSFPLATAPGAAGDHLEKLAHRLARSGFLSMIRPHSMSRKPQIYLLDPYDPSKIPLLMVHGLQSTPVAFASMVNALRHDPEISARYQIWQFYYPSGTPVLANAADLRESLGDLVKKLDPKNRDFATHNIVVVGHSMGGVISHTLVSSSGGKVWDSVFKIAPEELRGDQSAVLALQRILSFRRNDRVRRVIFMAAPHRGSQMADSWIGRIGNGLARLSPMEESGFSNLAKTNPDAFEPGAALFYGGGRFSAVRTLSPKSTALQAVAELPIEVPFYSIIGQARPGPVESGSDGVVSYRSSHLEGAVTEKVVRSGHGVIGNPEGIQEVLRILREPVRP